MAAVAGSKGRISLPSDTAPLVDLRPSFQASLVSQLLRDELTVAAAVNQMTPHARLREVGIDTNMTCNLKCRYCYLDDRPVRKGDLSVSEWVDILLPLAESGNKLFAIIGKEPLLDDTAVGVLERLNGHRHSGLQFRTGMVSNGTLLHRYIDRVLAANLSYLDISLDGLPNINDQWRGDGVADTVLRNIALYLSNKPRHDMFVACVMHKGNYDHLTHFAEHLFNMGICGFFTSPILKFTDNDNIENWAINYSQLEGAIESLITLAEVLQLTGDKQIVIDLPYSYAWRLLATGRVRSTEVVEDRFEVPFWQPSSTARVFVKMNLLSYSYWKAVRITHDGTVVFNMDMAAHPNYRAGALARPHHDWQSGFPDTHDSDLFHARFFNEHIKLTKASTRLFDRAVDAQNLFQAGTIAPRPIHLRPALATAY